jgi:hypothetical protein
MTNLLTDQITLETPTPTPTPAKPELPLHFDSTMRTAAASCLRKFYHEFVEARRPAGLSIDLHAGACFASALEEVYRQVFNHGKDLASALLMAEAKFFQEWGDVEPPDWKRTAKTKDRVWEAIEFYFSQWSPLTDHAKPYIAADGKATLEYSFAIPLEPACDSADFDRVVGGGTPCFPLHPSGSPFIYCGRFDMLANLNGRPAPKDDKTTGASIGQNWVKQWDMRGQFLGYLWALQQCGIDAKEVVVRGLAIQKTQFVNAEAIKPYSQYLIAKWHEQLRRDLWRIRRAWDENYWDYNFGDSCTAYGLCPYLDACTSPNPDQWLTDFEVRRWNPLDKNPVGNTSTATIHSR